MKSPHVHCKHRTTRHETASKPVSKRKLCPFLDVWLVNLLNELDYRQCSMVTNGDKIKCLLLLFS
ncbi:hypothetical protein FD35_GL002491 [Furfurilactobacillus rossiae DSM 15814]|uniref:Uncharacterized protein n=1 Tax=Furfurilactobacillus rossiae DSM 15814 TaxID=1114972 RepID=A0A0R1RDA1_9LACO|nr:hypothetical protein FD35_GL002491 [Furfurilactobacillus rossiae DSM 15814]